MVLQTETKIVQSKDAHTQYLLIPAVMVQDSQYPFKEGEKIRITIDTGHKRMIIESIMQEPQVKVSRDGTHVKRKRIVVENRKAEL
jgi:hypothetical protein